MEQTGTSKASSLLSQHLSHPEYHALLYHEPEILLLFENVACHLVVPQDFLVGQLLEMWIHLALVLNSADLKNRCKHIITLVQLGLSNSALRNLISFIC